MVSFLVRPSSWTRTRRTSKNGDSNVVNLASLAEQGKFDKLLKRLIEMDNARFLLELLVSTSNNDDDGMKNSKEGQHKKKQTCSSLLHVALANRAPLRVVETLLGRINECCTAVSCVAGLVPEEIQEDASGKTPLHVAAENGCDVNVIERLLNGETLIAPAYTKDKFGRYPLHWACCLPRETKERKIKQKKKTIIKEGEHHNKSSVYKEHYYKGKMEIRRETIYMLLRAYPVAAVIPDLYGMTPLDYARSIQLDPHTIHALATVAKVHGDVQVLAIKRKVCKKYVGNNNDNQRYDSPLLSRNLSETTERESTDEDDDEQDEASSSSSSLPEGTMSYGEILFEHSHDMDDDISSLGSSQENDETESSANKIVEEQPVATYVRPFSVIKLQ